MTVSASLPRVIAAQNHLYAKLHHYRRERNCDRDLLSRPLAATGRVQRIHRVPVQHTGGRQLLLLLKRPDGSLRCRSHNSVLHYPRTQYLGQAGLYPQDLPSVPGHAKGPVPSAPLRQGPATAPVPSPRVPAMRKPVGWMKAGRRSEERWRGPDFGRCRPDFGRRRPDSGRRRPDSGRRRPDSGRRRPDSGRRRPDSGRHRPDFRRRGPDSGRRRPDFRRRGPDLGSLRRDLGPLRPDSRPFWADFTLPTVVVFGFPEQPWPATVAVPTPSVPLFAKPVVGVKIEEGPSERELTLGFGFLG
jgi:hypothetical protein